MAESITILGGGNTAFSVAANLSLAGAEVTLCEYPEFKHTLKPLEGNCRIELDGVANTGSATIHKATCDFAEALSSTDLALLIVPAYAHRNFANACAPHLRSGQIVVLMPGTLGSLEFARIVREKGAPDDVVIAEVDTAPYVCRKMSPASAHIWGIVDGLGLGVFPSTESERVRGVFEPWFPGLKLYENVLACGLASLNPVMHPAGVLLNAGRIEHSRGDFYFYDEGVTPAVCNLIYAVDRERRAVAAALGQDLPPVDDAFHSAGFGPKGDLWATINGSRMLTELKAPGKLETRWLTEDVPYGLASWILLGEQFGVACPIMRALVDLNSELLKIPFWDSARTPRDLGIEGMSKPSLSTYLESGARE